MKIVHTGIDTLDVSFTGALGIAEQEILEAALSRARDEKADQLVQLGPAATPFTLKPHGKQGGYRYTLIDGPTGAIYSFKKGNKIAAGNIFVSVRAARFLVSTYEDTKNYIVQTLAQIGCKITDHSVNRVDIALDIHVDDFDLDIAQFVCPARSKLRTCWQNEQYLFDDGEKHSSVMTGAKVRSATIGTMPNRQLILYDKGQAAIDLRQPYWFPVWKLDRETMTGKVWRIEVRAGRGALEKFLVKRTYDFVDSLLPKYVEKTLSDIRYLERRDKDGNVTRAAIHPLWKFAQETAKTILDHRTPPILDNDLKNIIRQQRAKMIQDQVTGCMVRSAAMAGHSAQEIRATLPQIASQAIKQDLAEKGGEWLDKKTKNTFASLGGLIG